MIYFDRRLSFLIFTCAFFFLFFIFYSCQHKTENKTQELKYASLSDSTEYVGIETCKRCHEDKYQTFIQTGMGMSFGRATRNKSSANFSDRNIITDKYKNLNYHPYWSGDSLTLCEFRLAGKDTSFKREETISWIVGSGQHTNSHLANFNGYVYQVPATFYTQKKVWDLPPGFENGYNTRFSRAIGLECMTCHNAFPKFVSGSENKYTYVANGIDCERCHGPGSKHVKEKLAGNIIPTDKEIDYTIVNPAKLPVELQLDVCQRCHIQGNAVLKDGKSFFDFKPGMHLSEVMDVYMPLFKGDEDSHIMASHVERLKKSRCFINSVAIADSINEIHPSLTPYKNAMTCVTCHDPHVSVRQTDQSVFNNKCKSCHSDINQSHPEKLITAKTVCTEAAKVRALVGDNCVKCHMPKNGTIDIPHVSVTDHWIRIPLKRKEIEEIQEFTGLVCINNSKADKKSKGTAYLSYFEKFSSNPVYLDSAKKYFDDVNKEDVRSNFQLLIRWAFLKKDYERVISYVNSIPDAVNTLNKTSLSSDDAWTAYRIGESFLTKDDYENAIPFFQRSVDLAPFIPDFRNKLAGAQLDKGIFDKARMNYEFILKENPKYASAYVSLGFLILTSDKDAEGADRMYDKALALDPDNIQAFFNKAGIKIYQGRKREATFYLKEILKRDNDNERAKMLLNTLSSL